jgi:hypothetical protein
MNPNESFSLRTSHHGDKHANLELKFLLSRLGLTCKRCVLRSTSTVFRRHQGVSSILLRVDALSKTVIGCFKLIHFSECLLKTFYFTPYQNMGL